MHPETRYKLCKCGENRARDTPLWGVYIPKIGQISVKFSVFGVLYIIPSVHLSVSNFTPIGATCLPCRAKKPHNGPLE